MKKIKKYQLADFIEKTLKLENSDIEKTISFIVNNQHPVDTSFIDVNHIKNEEIKEWNIYTGDLHIDGDFYLEGNLIVTGNLTINGIFDDYSSLLIVFGTMSCEHLLSDWDLFVNELIVEGVACNYHSNCITSINKGKCTFEILHDKCFEGEFESDYCINSFDSKGFFDPEYIGNYGKSEFEREFLEQYLVDGILDEYFYEEGVINVSKTIELIRNGKTIFKPNAKKVLAEYKLLASKKFPIVDLPKDKIDENILTNEDVDNYPTDLKKLNHAFDLSIKLQELKEKKDLGQIDLKEYLTLKRDIENQLKT